MDSCCGKIREIIHKELNNLMEAMEAMKEVAEDTHQRYAETKYADNSANRYQENIDITTTLREGVSEGRQLTVATGKGEAVRRLRLEKQKEFGDRMREKHKKQAAEQGA